MYEPVDELYKGDPELFLETEIVLGEKHGKLFGCHDMNDSNTNDYRQRGGAVYKSVHLADDTLNEVRQSRSLRVAPTMRCNDNSLFSQLAYLPRLILSLPSRIVDKTLCVVASALPVLRFAFPTALSHSSAICLSKCTEKSSNTSQSNSTLSSSRQKVITIAFHPYFMWLAIAIAESKNYSFNNTNSSNNNSKISNRYYSDDDDDTELRHDRIIIYDVSNEIILCTLTHAFQYDVRVVAWKPMSRDTLLVGCKGGVLVWCLSSGVTRQCTLECNATSPVQNASLYLHAKNSFAGVTNDTNNVNANKNNKCNFNCYNSEGKMEQTYWDTTRREHHHLRSFTVNTQAKLSAKVDLNQSAWALFYSFPQRELTVTSLACTRADGCRIACGSSSSVEIALLDLSTSPCHSHYCTSKFIASVTSGIHSLMFAHDEVTLIATYCHAPIITLTSIECTNYKNSIRIATSAPVLAIIEAVAVGLNYYFMQFENIDGVALAKITPMSGIEVMSLISTNVSRGIGGLVRVMMCSSRRLWLATETNHLIVCQYGAYQGQFTLIPISVAAMETTHMDSFHNCTTGSLLALVERNEEVHFIPHYHM